jgi:hypothetical protein
LSSDAAYIDCRNASAESTLVPSPAIPLIVRFGRLLDVNTPPFVRVKTIL